MSSSNRRTNSNVKQKDGRDRRTSRTKQFKDFVDRRNKDRSQQRSSRTSPPTSSRLSFHSDREPPPVAKANSIGKVTQIDKDCGVVNDEVFFSVRVCRGQVPKLGSRVLYKAHPGTSTLRRQCSWIATRIQELEPPSSSSRSRSSAANKDGVAPDSRRRRCSPEDEGKSSLEIIQQGWEELERSREELRQSRAELERSREQLHQRSSELRRSRSRERHESQHWEREPVVIERREHSNERHYINRMEEEPLCPSQQWSEQTSEQVRHAVREVDRTPLQIESRPQQQRWQEPENNIRHSRCELEDDFRNHMAIMEQQQHREQLQSRSRSPENVYQMQQQCDNYMREDEKEQSTNYRLSQEKWHSSNAFAHEIELRESRREPQTQSRRLSPATNMWQMQDQPRIAREEPAPNEGISEMRGNSEENRDWCLQSQNKHDMLIETTQNERSHNHMNMREELIFQNQERRDQSQSHIMPSSGLSGNDRHCELKDFQSHQSFNRDIHDRKWEMTQNEHSLHERRYSNNEEWREQTRASNDYLQSEEPHKLFQDQQMQNSFQDVASTDFGADSNQPSLMSQEQFKRPSGAQRRKIAKELAYAQRQINKAKFLEKVSERRAAKSLKEKANRNEYTAQTSTKPLSSHSKIELPKTSVEDQRARYKWVAPKEARPALLQTPSTNYQLPPQVAKILARVEPARNTNRQQPHQVSNRVDVARDNLSRKAPPQFPQFTNSLDYLRQAMSSNYRRTEVSNSNESARQQQSKVTKSLSPQAPPPPIISQQHSSNDWISTPPRTQLESFLQRNNIGVNTKLAKEERKEVKHNCWCIIVDDAHSKGYIEEWYSTTFDQKFKTALASANLTSLVKRGWMNKQHVYQITLASPNCAPLLQSFVANHFFKPWSIAKLRLVTAKDLTSVNLFVPLSGGRYNPKALLKKLRHKELHTHMWHFQKSLHMQKGIKIWVDIDEKSYQFLVKKRGLIPYNQNKILFKQGGYAVGRGQDGNYDDNDDDDNDNGDDDNGDDDNGDIIIIDDDDDNGDDDNADDNFEDNGVDNIDNHNGDDCDEFTDDE